MSRFVKNLGIVRGQSDVLVGAAIGWFVFQSAGLVAIIAGASGGFSFWRSRGYPGLEDGHHESLDEGYNIANIGMRNISRLD